MNLLDIPVEEVGNVLDKLFTSDEERLNAEAVIEKLRQHKDDLIFADKESARKREMEVKDWVPKFLAVTVTFGFFGTLVAMMIDDNVSQVYRDILGIMVGSLGTVWINVTNYYFGGTSKDNKEISLPKPF